MKRKMSGWEKIIWNKETKKLKKEGEADEGSEEKVKWITDITSI